MPNQRDPAILALEDGTIFRGRAFGARGERAGEVVFNTSMMGYQEILTDPSYEGQIVTMTYPLIGNYGVNDEDIESPRPYVAGFAVREYSPYPSNWRSAGDLSGYLERHNVGGIEDIDTRKLTRHIRTHGAMRGVLSAVDLDPDSLVQKALAAPKMVGLDLARVVTTEKRYAWSGWTATTRHSHPDGVNQMSLDIDAGEQVLSPGSSRRGAAAAGHFHVVAIDYGCKRNILRMLTARGCETLVVPATTSAEDILSYAPDGIFLSNGPGDPEPMDYAIETIRRLLGKRPIFAICLGHQLLGLALGGRTYKLKFGHHGGNHPVKNLERGTVEITAQNHGFAVDMDSLKGKPVRETHVNLNDGTNEGLRHLELPVFSVQYHPEASPGPHDASYLFDQFIEMMGGG
jgi:carbamoyl-phosphate synthase small subunit